MNSIQKTQKSGRTVFSLVMTVAVICLMTAVIIPGVMGVATDVPLGEATHFAILSKTGITDVPPSVISGDIGASPIPASAIHPTCPEVTGTVYGIDPSYAGGAACYATGDVATAPLAVSDMQTAYTTLNGEVTAPIPLAGSLSGLILAPGLYKTAGGVLIPGDVTLDAAGDPTAVWVFQIGGTLDISASQHVVLAGGARADHIYWVVAGATTLGANSVFNGNILDQTMIAMQNGAVLNGRALAQTAVTLDHNVVTRADLIALPIAAPTALSAATNATGTTITITFDKAMANPASKVGSFKYQVGGGADQPFSAAALNADTTKIDLTTSGTPIAPGDVVTVNYTAGTVRSADTGVLATFADLAVTNNMVAAPTVSSAATNVTGTTITLTFDKAMANPAGKVGEFKYQLGGGADQPFSAAALNADTHKIDLTTSGTLIAPGDVVTVNYTAGTVTSADTGVLASFADQAVTNNMVSVPTVTSAATNVAGTTITLTFDKAMANPAGKAGLFKYQIGGGLDEPFSTATLNADTHKIDLTTSGTPLAAGDVVTVNYTAGTVTSADTGILASFADQAVSNNMPLPPNVTVISPSSGVIGGGETVTITGTGFLGATKVTFDTTDVIPVTVSATTITAIAPAHAAGIVDVTVTTPVSTSATSSAGQYSYGIPGSAAVNLGSADNFVVLAKSGISTTGLTKIYGDIGVSPVAAIGITGFGLVADASNQFSRSALVNGNIYASDYAVPTPVTMTTAISDMEAAYNDAAGRTLPDHTELGAGNIGSMTLTPGLYKWSSGVTIPRDVTIAGGPDDVWIFQIAQGLTTNSDTHVILSGGAQAKNIFWQVAGQTTLGSDSEFNGIILDKSLIVMDSGAALNGKALAQTAVTFIANNVNVPALVPSVIAPIPTPVYNGGGINGGSDNSDRGTSPSSAGAASVDNSAASGLLAPGMPSSVTPVNGNGLLASTPLIVDFSGMTGVTVTWTTQINDNPAANAQITTAIQPNADQSTLDAMTAGLHLGGLDINNVAYGMVFQNTGSNSTGPTTVTMTISPDWVTQNGGKDAIRIVRIADDGTVEVLHTWFSGYDSYSGYPTFTATSPQGGLGTSFWLISVNPYTPPTSTATPVGAQMAPTQAPATSTTPVASNGVPLMMTIGGIFAALAIVGVATMIVIRRNK